LSHLTYESITQGVETANSNEENNGGAEEEEMSDMVLTSTFLGGVTGAALGSFLTAGRAAPIFGEVASLYLSIYHHTNNPQFVVDGRYVSLYLCVCAWPLTDDFSQVFSLLSDIKEHCQIYQQVEEESKRMSVWCVSLMALFGRLADETTGEENSEQMLENAASALKKVRNLIIKRNQTSKGLLGKASAFWTSAEFRNQIKIASAWLEKAIQALSLNVSVQTNADVSQVLSKVDILPQMNESLLLLKTK